jgi:hypothetical protein
MVHLDFLQPFYYHVEKQAVSKGIPNAANIANRLVLKDHLPIPSCDSTPSFDHSLWNNVLQRHVTTNQVCGNGITGVNTVNYEALSQDPEYEQYMQALSTAKPESLPKAAQLAFWMNAYNAACIHVIIQHESHMKNESGSNSATDELLLLKSITKISNPQDGPVWDRPAAMIGGVPYSLNKIEHVMLRQKWAEVAIHGCIVCASASCPNLRNEAYDPERLMEQMNDQMKEWMLNTTKGLSVQDGSHGRKIDLSRIFLWFASDFGGWNGIRHYLPQFMSDDELAKKITKNQVAVRYFKYDWAINRTPGTGKSHAIPSTMIPTTTSAVMNPAETKPEVSGK